LLLEKKKQAELKRATEEKERLREEADKRERERIRKEEEKKELFEREQLLRSMRQKIAQIAPPEKKKKIKKLLSLNN